MPFSQFRIGKRRVWNRKPRKGTESFNVPLLDVGTVAKIRSGAIKVRGDIDRVTSDGVVFKDTGRENFDVIVLATGFRPNLRALLPDAEGVLDPEGKPLASGKPTAEPGLFFCGAIASPTGQLREIGIEAQRIARMAKGNAMARQSAASPRSGA